MVALGQRKLNMVSGSAFGIAAVHVWNNVPSTVISLPVFKKFFKFSC